MFCTDDSILARAHIAVAAHMCSARLRSSTLLLTGMQLDFNSQSSKTVAVAA
jgi:hypothetical protein